MSQQIVPMAFSCKDAGQDFGPVCPTLRAMPHQNTWANGGGQVAIVFVVKEADRAVR